VQRPEKLYIIVDVTLTCAAAGVLLMSVEPWAATRKAIHYCGCDTHVCFRWCAADVHVAMYSDHKGIHYIGCVTHVCCRWCSADVRGAMGCYEKS